MKSNINACRNYIPVRNAFYIRKIEHIFRGRLANQGYIPKVCSKKSFCKFPFVLCDTLTKHTHVTCFSCSFKFIRLIYSKYILTIFCYALETIFVCRLSPSSGLKITINILTHLWNHVLILLLDKQTHTHTIYAHISALLLGILVQGSLWETNINTNMVTTKVCACF